MEIAIRFVVILFVVLVVGSLIIVFARNTFENIDDDLKRIRFTEKQYVIEDESISIEAIEHLIQQCYDDKSQTSVDNLELCFVLHTPIGFNPADIPDFTFTVDKDFSAGINALFIYYEISEDKIIVQR